MSAIRFNERRTLTIIRTFFRNADRFDRERFRRDLFPRFFVFVFGFLLINRFLASTPLVVARNNVVGTELTETVLFRQRARV